MGMSLLVAGLNVLIACVGVLFLVLAIYEYRSLAQLRDDFGKIKEEFRADLYRTQKAMHRVIASYRVQDPESKIKLLAEATTLDPRAFNAYNALGYAYLEAGEDQKALDAFKEAVSQHPREKAGYFDLARAYMKAGERDLAAKYLGKAIEVDPTSKADLAGDPAFEELASHRELSKLLQ